MFNAIFNAVARNIVGRPGSAATREPQTKTRLRCDALESRECPAALSPSLGQIVLPVVGPSGPIATPAIVLHTGGFGGLYLNPQPLPPG